MTFVNHWKVVRFSLLRPVVFHFVYYSPEMNKKKKTYNVERNLIVLKIPVQQKLSLCWNKTMRDSAIEVPIFYSAKIRGP